MPEAPAIRWQIFRNVCESARANLRALIARCRNNSISIYWLYSRIWPRDWNKRNQFNIPLSFICWLSGRAPTPAVFPTLDLPSLTPLFLHSCLGGINSTVYHSSSIHDVPKTTHCGQSVADRLPAIRCLMYRFVQIRIADIPAMLAYCEQDISRSVVTSV